MVSLGIDSYNFYRILINDMRQVRRGSKERPSLQNLLEEVIPGIIASNVLARIECGVPNFILSRNKIDLGYIEAKDIGDELDKTDKTDQ